MKIDFNDDTPRYKQLINMLIRMMNDGKFTPGEKIPSENELTEQLSVSRTTVRQALNELVQQGLLERRKGQGTFFLGTESPKKDDRSRILGVIMPSLTFTIYPQIVQGIEEVSHHYDYNALFGNTNSDRKKEIRLLEQMLDKNIDGLIIEPSLSATITPEHRIFKMLKTIRIPYVLVDHEIKGLDASYVVLDDVGGGHIGTNYLIQKGHKKIGLIYKAVVQAGMDRMSGYRQALAENGITAKEEYIKSYREEDEIHDPANYLTKELMNLPDPPTAIFYFNDETAIHGYRALRETGLRVGRDISVLGYDDSTMAAAADVPLTTLTHPKFYMGKWAADILFREIDSRDPTVRTQLMIRPSVVERNSVISL